MKVIIDTSSLLSLVRYYLPFDTEEKLFTFIKQEIKIKTIIVIKAVLEECKKTAKGLVTNKLTYLKDKNFKPYNTNNLVSPDIKKFEHMVNHNFITPKRKELNDSEFETERTDFLNSADGQMIILAYTERHAENKIMIVTEESETANDNKTFQKIPTICKKIDIDVMTLPKLLEKQVDIKFNIKEQARRE